MRSAGCGTSIRVTPRVRGQGSAPRQEPRPHWEEERIKRVIALAIGLIVIYVLGTSAVVKANIPQLEGALVWATSAGGK